MKTKRLPLLYLIIGLLCFSCSSDDDSDSDLENFAEACPTENLVSINIEGEETISFRRTSVTNLIKNDGTPDEFTMLFTEMLSPSLLGSRKLVIRVQRNLIGENIISRVGFFDDENLLSSDGEDLPLSNPETFSSNVSLNNETCFTVSFSGVIPEVNGSNNFTISDGLVNFIFSN